MLLHAAGVILGGFLGWLYWYKVGCVSGTCMIWANPWIATSYGALLGFFVAGLIPVKKKQQGTPSEQTEG